MQSEKKDAKIVIVTFREAIMASFVETKNQQWWENKVEHGCNQARH